jgi:hypothetical protein
VSIDEFCILNQDNIRTNTFPETQALKMSFMRFSARLNSSQQEPLLLSQNNGSVADSATGNRKGASTHRQTFAERPRVAMCRQFARRTFGIRVRSVPSRFFCHESKDARVELERPDHTSRANS